MKIVINNCYGGFSLSHEAVMKYAKLKGMKLYPFVNDSPYEFDKFKPYNGEKDVFLVYYAEKPLKEDGTYESGSYFSERDIDRTDKNLIKVIEKLGKRANGSCANLKIVEIPDDIKWKIEEYDGIEWIAEEHRTWE